MDNELLEFIGKYEHIFNDKFSLFIVDANIEKSIEIIKKCIDQNKTVEGLRNITYDENTLY